jgi:hypothetical protein
MKNSHLLIWGLLSLSGTQCSKTPSAASVTLEKCNLPGKFTNIENEHGKVYFTNEVGGVALKEFTYIIISDKQRLPLLLCNYPVSAYSLKEKESRFLTFSGKVEVLPAETDAVTLNAEFSSFSF